MSSLPTKFFAVDKSLFLLCNNRIKSRILDGFCKHITHTGGAASTIAVTLAALLTGIASQQQLIMDIGIRAATSLSGSYALVHIIKRLVNRPRPAIKLPEIRVFDVPICAYSFPSGHTTASFAIAITCALVHPMLVLPSVAWAGSVGFSRIYLGVHYPSDVLVGGIIGSAAAVLSNIAFFG